MPIHVLTSLPLDLYMRTECLSQYGPTVHVAATQKISAHVCTRVVEIFVRLSLS